MRRAGHGVVAALADGVGSHPGGRVTAEVAGRGFMDFCLGHPETAGVARAAARAAEAVDSWVHAQSRTDPARTGMATTLTAVVLRGRWAHVQHDGDSGLYRLRHGRLARLTEDHVRGGPNGARVLRRAVGLEDALRADYAADPLLEGDRLAPLTDGVHGAPREAALTRHLGRAGVSPERLIFAERCAPELYMARLGAADLFLDTFPYGAGTVASDAVRMGLPLLTRCGRSYASRMAARLLDAVGAGGGIVRDAAGYVETAVRLASDARTHAGYKTLFGRDAWEATIGNTGRFIAEYEASLVRLVSDEPGG